MAPLVWFITGGSSGFGYQLSLHALAAGHNVIATVRNTTKSADAVNGIESRGGKVIELDVTNAETVPDVVKKAESIYGRVDVLVNNAGYSLLGAIEDISDDEALAQFNTNFLGPLRLIRSFLPSLRAQGNGTIVNVSSIAGQNALPSCGLYASSKFALEALSESLAQEVAPFNISVLIVEPGGFRTNFLSAVQKTETSLSEPYRGGPVDEMLGKFESAQGKQPGDAEKAAARIFGAVTGEGVGGELKGRVLRLPLGPDCVNRLEVKLKSVSADLEASRDVAMSTNIDE
ncbi:putative short chain oxidoreductase/dehydrogenase [Aspergillus affinis]|uniref:putative short chain oxidoreductase/dehydrogenase n=1 Tax=Aspergillus affinis TaxID=1070780 RepID=UPI0022FE4990|nr:putative short chain oxidoreductase/dehydrogenase [Aspergillus affinis]KAI9039224.1 putative short chain oxidoreductase/dehydrogenase [Aspergillus affinis]